MSSTIKFPANPDFAARLGGCPTGCSPSRHARERQPVVAVWVAPTPELAALIMRQNLRIAELERQLREIRIALGQQQNRYERAAAHIQEHDPCMADVVRVTNELFPGKTHIEIISDPEEPESSSVVFTVSATGDSQDIVTRRLEWHRRIANIPAGNSGTFALSVIPV